MRLLISVLLFLSLTTVSIAQFQNIKQMHPLSGKSSLGIEGGITYTRSDFRENDIDLLGRLSFEYFFPGTNPGVFGLEGFVGGGFLTAEGGTTSSFPDADYVRTDILYAGAAATYNIALSKKIIPYLSAGLSYLYFEPEVKDSEDRIVPITRDFSPHTIIILGELGFRVLFNESVGFRLSAGVDFVPTDNLDKINNSVSGGTDRDIFFSALAGLNFYFGGIRDSDSDGVADKEDICPNTLIGVIVDEFGCPVDTDRDGVPDYLDTCPNTPANIPVDENGCPSDADRDGVPDFRDLCPDTPNGVPVNERGCPFDSDGDGIPDYKDLCPDTPIGFEVDKWGCEVKQEVTTVMPETKFILSGTLNFEIGKANLLSNAIAELDKMVKVMREYPDTKWRIEGHTDNTGSPELNKKLSYNRAQAVYNYLTSKGIESNRFNMIGMGPDNPVADNSTETGRALNRRVMIVLIDDQTNFGYNSEMSDLSSYSYNSNNEKNVGEMIFTDGKVYVIQVSSLRDRSKAESHAVKLKAAGYNSFVTEVNLPQLDGKWYRVRVGFYSTLSEAQAVKERAVGVL